MVFFKRLSRSRSNSQSYVDNYDSRHDSKTNSATYDDKFAVASPIDNDSQHQIPGSRQSNTVPQQQPADLGHKSSGSQMYARTSQPTEVGHGQYGTHPMGGHASNGYVDPNANRSYENTSSYARKAEPTPDLLLQAFNQALRPYNDKVENLENEIADLKAYIDQLEAQQRDVHAWIDKRGLRPGESRSLLWIQRG